jgi:hypothetical protein
MRRGIIIGAVLLGLVGPAWSVDEDKFVSANHVIVGCRAFAQNPQPTYFSEGYCIG